MRAHGCRLTGKMTGDGAVLIDCASVTTLVESSVITQSLFHFRFDYRYLGGNLTTKPWNSMILEG